MRRPRSRSPEDSDAVDVLIVEDEDEDVAADEVRTVLHELALEAMARRATWIGDPRSLPYLDVAVPARASLGRRLARRYRRQAVTGAVLAVAVAVTTSVVDARETAARAAALAAEPAVLAEGSGALTEAWRVPGRVVGGGDDVLLVVDGTSLQGVEPATGEVVWTASTAAGRAAAAGGCSPLDDGLGSGGPPVDDGAGPPGLVACVEDGTTRGARVVVVDPGTGRTVHTIAADGSVLLAEPIGRDLLVATVGANGTVRATRWAPAAGTPRWDRTSPPGALPDGVPDAVPEAVRRRPDSLTVGTFAVDLATGAALDVEREGREPYPSEEHALPDGRRSTWSWNDDGTSGRGRVSGGASGRAYSLPGPPLWPPITDGSHARVLLVAPARGDRLRGIDLGTGRMRWTRPYPGASRLSATALVDGTMLVDDGDTVAALDVRTGDELWRARADAAVTDGAALTDGRVVVLPTRADDGSLHLVARRITDGTVVRRTEAPAGTVSMTVVGHRLVASTDDTVIGLS